ncbi:MAG TPA: hypothetical protein VNO22_18750 [Planctomycetota bacterium]|nr:hypothetical protein [Planctomycetota bacterium]
MQTPHDDDEGLLLPERFAGKLLAEAARILNFIALLARSYRPPEFVRFLNALARGLERFRKDPSWTRSRRL